MIEFNPPCQHNEVNVVRAFDQSTASGPSWVRQINPRSMRSFRIEWENPMEADAAYVRGLFKESISGVLPVTFGSDYEVQGDFRITGITTEQLSPVAWAVSATFEEVPE